VSPSASIVWPTASRCFESSSTARPRTGLAGAALYIGDVGGNLLGALGCRLHVAGNLLGGSTLLFHGCRDGGRDLGQFFDGAADFLDRIHRLLRRRLDSGDLLTDLAGRLRGLLGQRLDLGRYDRKTAAGFTGAGRLMVAFSAKRLVCPAMVLMSSTTSPMRAAAFDNSLTRSLVLRA
jgi:hypothetical protein